MKSVIKFIKGIKVISWILIAFAVIAFSLVSTEEVGLFAELPILYLYLLVPAIVEICSNPVIKNSSLTICKFLSSTKIISRIFFYFFGVVVISCMMPGEDMTSSLIAVFYFLIPAALIEWRKNGYIRSLRSDKKVKLEESQEQKNKEVVNQ
jgi:hypothetical protein